MIWSHLLSQLIMIAAVILAASGINKFFITLEVRSRFWQEFAYSHSCGQLHAGLENLSLVDQTQDVKAIIHLWKAHWHLPKPCKSRFNLRDQGPPQPNIIYELKGAQHHEQ